MTARLHALGGSRHDPNFSLMCIIISLHCCMLEGHGMHDTDSTVGDDVLLRCDCVRTTAPRGLFWPIVTTPMMVLFDGRQLFSFEGRRKCVAVDGPRCFMFRYKREG
jgi:hypothetical protein